MLVPRIGICWRLMPAPLATDLLHKFPTALPAEVQLQGEGGDDRGRGVRQAR